MIIIEALFFLPAVLFLFSGLPQTYKLLKTKKSEDISIQTYILTVIAIGIILLDAIIHKNWSIALSNGVSLAVTGTNLLLINKYK